MPRQDSKDFKLNPKSPAVKAIEMSVRRCIGLIKYWDTLDPDDHWLVEQGPYSKVGLHWRRDKQQIEILWGKYHDGTIFGMVLDVYGGLPRESQANIRKDAGELMMRSIRKRAKAHGK